MPSPHRALHGGNDEYFTSPEVAKNCVEILYKFLDDRGISYKNSQFIEPSSGDGSFLQFLPPTTISYDIAPKCKNVIKENFFNVSIPPQSIVVGNPPFGFACSVAIKFFNHSAKNKAQFIAFIVPKTFKKISIHKKLNPYYHLCFQVDLPKNSFLVDGIPYDVPCVFQIWGVENYIRENEVITPEYIKFVSKENAQFAIRRVGGRAGKVLEGTNYSESSTYFITSEIPNIKEIIKSIDFSTIVSNTSGVKSLSKKELLLAIHNHIINN